MGFDTIELNVGSLDVPEETLLRYVRLIKNGGLRAKPQFAVKFNKSDIPISGNRAFGAYIVPKPRSSGKVALLQFCSFPRKGPRICFVMCKMIILVQNTYIKRNECNNFFIFISSIIIILLQKSFNHLMA